MSRNPRSQSGPHAASVAADMSARALVSDLALTTAALLTMLFIGAGGTITCHRDGLYADYDSSCQEYVKCSDGVARSRYTCPAGRIFSEASGACVPVRPNACVPRECAPRDTLAYATPGTACRHYYRCDNGTGVDRACPSGSWFDLEQQACARGAGTCYEPVCAGLPDGEYPDPSHECRRALHCRAGELAGVGPCLAAACARECPPPRSAAVALPAGDADFCSDEACSSLCQDAADGAYADRSTGCREYFVCEGRRAIRRGVCEADAVFARGRCEDAARVACPPPAPSPCFNRADGLHRDWRACGAWLECRRERVVARGTCGGRLTFDGAHCVSPERFPCTGPERARACEGLPTGTYQDLESNCTRYFHCEGGMRTALACPLGEVFDGARCGPADAELCPSLQRDSCYGRADGRYRASYGTGCRGYYVCANGERAVYACAAGHVFDGERCVLARLGLCSEEDYSCDGLSDGYHAEIESGCKRYFYCEGGDRLATLSCLGGKIFDGQACVETSQHDCGASRKSVVENGKRCERDGFFVQEGTECSRYYFCVSGVRTPLKCGAGQAFNGQVCVSRDQYECPG